MENIYVVGVGMTRFGRLLDQSIKQLTRTAVEAALADAGIAADQIGAAFFANCVQGHMEGQHMIRGQIALREMGIGGIPVTNVESACTSGSTALNLAVNQLRAGETDVALAVGAEKMYSPDKAKMFASFDSGWDVTKAEENAERLIKLGAGLEVPEGTTSPYPYSVFMDVYAASARDHMKRYGTTQRQLAAVSAKNHQHSEHNPLSQYVTPMTVEEVLAAAPITYPLTLPMCSPISDGGAAAVVCTESGLERLGIDRGRVVRVRASVLRSGSDHPVGDPAQAITAIAARLAYEKAGVEPSDIDVVEVHDATAMGEIIQTELLGLCAPGEGGALAEAGETTVGGRIPVNPSGGLESKGHPIGATGLAQVHELVTQLRGEAGARQVENATVALAENGGGLIGTEEASACVTILSR
ncbi:thiolase family protein [Streptomyces sp. NPDC001833]|uniref:thiolase family protein n=1 Tax=Streptomyces sp. NPDC001833 TaxID=3154658 RepID=UPI00331BC572